ncbi:MAG: CHASE2 domain-containing serine/threonine-protein kinase [bacterium]
MPDVETLVRKTLLPGVAAFLLLFFASLQLRLLPLSPFFQRLEYSYLDLMFKLRGAIPPAERICIVAIDDASLQQEGAWPWPRRVLAALFQRVLAAQPSVVIGDFILPTKTDDLTGTAELAGVLRTFREQDNRGVILPYYFGNFEAGAGSPPSLPEPVAVSALVLFDRPGTMPTLPIRTARAVYYSDPDLLQAALPGGHINVFSDESAGDAAVRWENHLVRHAETYFPSLPLQVTKYAQSLTRAQMLVQAGVGVHLGGLLVPVDAQGRGWINYYGPPGRISTISATRVLRGHDLEKLNNKIVFIGVTAAGTQDFLQTPVSARMPGVEKLATVTSNILDQDMLLRPNAFAWIELCILGVLIFSAYFIGTKLAPVHAWLALAILCLVLALGSFALFVFARLWLQGAGLMLALIIASGAVRMVRPVPTDSGAAITLPAEERMPRCLGRFEINGLLGEGAMGKIYSGFDPTINRKVAIKTIRPVKGLSASGNAKMRRRFLHEAQAAGALNHPNIVTVYHADEAGPYSYLVMEFLEGKTLEEIIKAEGPLPLRRTLETLLPICDALQYAHQRGVVHRDLKPANIMCTGAGAVKLMDFGIAHILSSTLTQEGALLGTPSYMAPEQMLGEKVDGRADIFALGVVAYEMATRTQPFLGDTMAAISHRIVSGAVALPSELNALLPAAFDEVVQKALQKDKNLRYQTAMDFAVALVQLVEAG